MDLQSAKKQASAESRKDSKTKYFLNVDDDGEVSISKDYDKDSSTMCYKNGSEIALPEISAAPEPKQNKGTKQENSKTTNKTVATETANSMAKKASVSKKSAKKTSAKEKPALKTVVGEKKTLTVKAIQALHKAGHRVYRQSNPNAGGILIAKRIAKYKNADKTIDVIVVKTK